MKVLSIVSNPATHDPRVYNEAKSLIQKGYKVTVLGWDRNKSENLFEVRDGIRIIRLRNSKLMDMLKFDLLRIPFWWRLAYKRALEIWKNEGFDVVHCHDLDTLPIGVKLKKKLSVPLIYDAHEIWGYMISNDLPEFFVKHVMKKEKRLLKHVDAIITVNEPLKEYFADISDKPIHIIMNAKPLIKKEYSPSRNREFTLVYIGTLIPSRFILESIEVVGKIRGVRLLIGGKGKEKFVEKIMAEANTYENVSFLGLVPQEKVIEYTCKADAVLCMISPKDPNSSRALTNKQFEAMVCGRPVISTKGTYPGKFTEEKKCGLVVDYSKEALKEAIIELRDNPELRKKLGKNALKAALEEYNWEKQEKKLINLYKNLNMRSAATAR